MSEHIIIGDLAPRVQYLADGVQTAFPFQFPIFAAADLEVRLDLLEQVGGYAVAGAGQSNGGTVTFATPPAPGVRVTLRRALTIARTSDFQENGVLRARTLNDELDYQIAALQEVKDELGSALRTDPSEVGGLDPLPARDVRANRLLGFDAVGDVAVIDRGEATLTLAYPGAVPRSVGDKLAERISVRDFGGVGDGVTDDGAALQGAMDAATLGALHLEIGPGLWRTTRALKLGAGAAGMTMHGTIVYAGPADRTALEIGNRGGPRASQLRYRGLAVIAATQSPWTDERAIGIALHNLDGCQVEVARIDGFTIGLRTEGSGVAGLPAGFEDTNLVLGRISNNRIGLDIHCSQPGPNAWNNSCRYFGGHFSVASRTNPTISRYGVRLSRAPGAYALHNAHFFYGPAFELQNGFQPGGPGTPVDAIPFLNLTAGRAVIARDIRMEGCSRWVAEHANAGFNNDPAGRIDAQDCVYEVAYASNGGLPNDPATGLPQGDSYLVEVKYGPGVNRAGGTVIPLAQAAASTRCTRLLADLPSVRARAFRWALTGNPAVPQIGFEGCAVVSSNPAGPPTTLDGFAFAGLSGFTLGADSVSFPTSRGIGWVVRTDRCKEFEVAFDGNRGRAFALIFDAAETIITPTLVADPDGARTAATGIPPLPPGPFDPDPDPNRPDADPDPELPPGEIPQPELVPDPAGPVVRFSNSGTLYNPTAKWWTPGAETQDFTLSRLQRITLPAEAKFAIIGVSSLGDEGAGEDDDRDGAVAETPVLHAMRLYCPPEHAPAILFGGARRWGSRELTVAVDYDAPSIAGGGNTTTTVAVPGAWSGDLAQASVSLANALRIDASVNSTSNASFGNQPTVFVRLTNPGGSAADLDAATLLVRVTKPRL